MYSVTNHNFGSSLGISSGRHVFHGLVFVFVVALAAAYISEFTLFRALGLSPLVIGLLFGALLSNASHGTLPEQGREGISFAAKHILRAAIVLYGFRLSLAQVAALGIDGVTYAASMLVITLVSGVWLGRAFGIDRQQSILIASGAAVCGASAVLSVETAIRSEPSKATVAVATVIVFGTLFMFLLPYIYAHGALGLNDRSFAIMSGAVTHEVAQVAVIAAALPQSVAGDAVLTKMVRVLLLPGVLMVLCAVDLRAQCSNASKGLLSSFKAPPTYAILFVLVVLFNSSSVLSQDITGSLVKLDDFLLLIAMTAIGMETVGSKLRRAGVRPFVVGTLIACNLLISGWVLAKLLLN